MQEIPVRIDIFSFIIFLGVIQGLFLSFFFLNKRIGKRPATYYLGFLMLVLSLIILEIFLHHTAYMLHVIRLDNFSEPLSFAAAPLMFVYVYSVVSRKKPKYLWLHFVPFIFWFLYCILYFIQPLDLKFPHYLNYHYPDLVIELPDKPYRTDPLHLRRHVNELLMIHMASYLLVCIILVRKYFQRHGQSFFSSSIQPLSWLRNFLFLMVLILITLVAVKMIFTADLGDYLVGSLIAVVIYATSFNIIRRSEFFQESFSDALNPKTKYLKSSLQDEEKNRILKMITTCMQKDQEFRNHLVSLKFISKKVNVPVHHISQVINEKMKMSFFEMIATYRIEEAKRILSDMKSMHLTIEEIADEVGYNSKSAFNRSFKKMTGMTPSQFRESGSVDK